MIHAGKELSPQAQRLVDLVYEGKRTLQEVLRSEPELMSGLDEYTVWYGEKMSAIAGAQETPTASHSMKEVIQKIKKT